MTGVTSIDLSQLAAPDIVETPSHAAIVADMIAYFAAALPDFDTPLPTDPSYILFETFAYRELLMRQRINEAARGVMLAFAAGTDLDHLAALVGVERLLVTPADEEAGTPDIYETDDELRYRVQLAPEGFSVAGPAAAYEFFALSADATIAAARATSPEPGEVLVSILSRTGDGTANDDQIDMVTAALSDDERRPLTDNVTVASAEIVPYTIDARLTLLRGPDPAIVLQHAEAALAAYIAASRKIGRDVTRAGIIARVGVEGVLNVNLVAPASDVVIAATQCGNCAGSSVTAVGFDD